MRPMSLFDVVSATRRLVSSRKWFAAAPEYAEAIFRGKAVEFIDALMAALGNATAKCAEDTCAIADLYTSNKRAHEVPLSMAEAGGDAAAGTPATSLAQACSRKGTLQC